MPCHVSVLRAFPSACAMVWLLPHILQSVWLAKYSTPHLLKGDPDSKLKPYTYVFQKTLSQENFIFLIYYCLLCDRTLKLCLNWFITYTAIVFNSIQL